MNKMMRNFSLQIKIWWGVIQQYISKAKYLKELKKVQYKYVKSDKE